MSPQIVPATVEIHQQSAPKIFDRAVQIITMLGAITVPIVVGVVGSSISQSIEQRAVDAEYVYLAVGVLSTPIPEARVVGVGDPSHETVDKEIQRDRTLREWAVRVLEASSPIKLDRRSAESLGEGSQVLPALPLDQSPMPTTSLPSVEPATPTTNVQLALLTDDLFRAQRPNAVKALTDAGFKVNDYLVCSGSVGEGQVRQILGPEGEVLLDIGGVTASGREINRGAAIEVKIGNGQPCN